MSFFDNWKEYLNRAKREKHSTACQAAFYWIIAKFNEAHWADEITLTDSELMSLTQIRSTKTIADVKSRLKLSGVIDFRTSKYYGTTYKLVQLASTSWSETQTESQSKVQGKGQSKAPPFINYTLNTKQEDLKTVEDEEDRVHASDNGGDYEIPCSRKIRVEWINATGVNPSDRVSWDLGEMEQRHGTEKLTEAIRKAVRADSNGGNGINIEFVQSKLNQLVYGKKGEQKNGSSSGRRSEYENLK